MLQQMAELVVAIPGLTPSAFWELTVEETYALVAQVNKVAKERGKANKKRPRRRR